MAISVMLGYDDMVTHKAALDGKDIHLCVDVYADANGQLAFDKDKLPQGLKKLYFQNTHQDVTMIGDDFLSHCNNLTHVDLSGLTNLTTIGGGFFPRCTGLKEIKVLKDKRALIERGVNYWGRGKIVEVK